MRNITKKIAIVAGAMIGLGLILAIIGGLTGGMGPIHFGKDGFSVGYHDGNFSSKDFTTKRESLNEFSNIDVNVDWYDIEFVQGEDYAVEYTYYNRMEKPIIGSKGTNLTINEKQHKNKINFLNGLDFFKNSFGPEIKIYYPKNVTFNDVKIQNAAGDVKVKDMIAKKLDVNLDIGNVTVSNVTTDLLNINISVGDCNLKNMIALNGDISLDLGDLTSEDLNTKGLEVENTAGDITLQGAFFGENSIENDLGDIEINTTLPEKDYNYKLEVDLGDAEINGSKAPSELKRNNGAANHMEIGCSMGDVQLNFE